MARPGLTPLAKSAILHETFEPLNTHDEPAPIGKIIGKHTVITPGTRIQDWS